MTSYDKECERICRIVIARLQSISDRKFSGDDSPLQNTWEEICVQVQLDRSPFWFAYLELVESFVGDLVPDLPIGIKAEIWLQTEDGIDWELEHEWPLEMPPFSDCEVIEHIVSEFILEEAGACTNDDIEDYLDNASR